MMIIGNTFKSPHSTPFHRTLPIWEMHATTISERFWNLVDPIGADKYVEVLPPLHVWFMRPELLPDEPERLDWIKKQLPEGNDDIFLRKTVQRDGGTVSQLVRSFPIPSFILGLLLITILCSSMFFVSCLRLLSLCIATCSST
jgi:hypothetical protein